MKKNNALILGKTLIFLLFFSFQMKAQPMEDTLKHFDLTQDPYTTISYNPGTSPIDWGFRYGHSPRGLYEFAEKFFISDSAFVQKILVYLDGKTKNNDSVRFKVNKANGRPGKALDSTYVDNSKLKFGVFQGPTMAVFDKEVRVEDSFFVNVGFSRYGGGQYNGYDSLAIITTTDGTRPASDKTWFRNAVRFDGGNWEDPASPIAFGPNQKDSLYLLMGPIVTYQSTDSSGNPTTISPLITNDHGVRLNTVYPNPAEKEISISFNLDQPARVKISLLSISGQMVMNKNLGNLKSGSYEQSFPAKELKPGTYLYILETSRGIMGGQFIKQ